MIEWYDFHKVDYFQFVNSLTKNVDLLSTILVMLTLALGSLCIIFFAAFQLHGEVAHLVKLGGLNVFMEGDVFRKCY